MSYSNLAGNGHVPNILETVIQRKRVAHAYLFTGQEGLGKKRFAIEFARTLLCPVRKPPDESCGTCWSCRRFDQLPPDALEYSGPNFRLLGVPADEKTIPIKEVREATREIYLRPPEGQRHALIIDPAEALSDEAMNALLKTLEEPPSYATLILITTNAAQLLPTIVSRCHVIPFYPIGDEEMKRLLTQKLGKDPARIAWIVRMARGSIGTAMALCESDLEETQKLMNQVFTEFRDGRLDNMIDVLFPKGGPTGEAQRARARMALEFFVQAFRELLRIRTGVMPSKEAAFAHPATFAPYTDSDPETIVQYIEALQSSQRAINQNANVKLSVYDGLLTLLQPVSSLKKTL